MTNSFDQHNGYGHHDDDTLPDGARHVWARADPNAPTQPLRPEDAPGPPVANPDEPTWPPNPDRAIIAQMNPEDGQSRLARIRERWSDWWHARVDFIVHVLFNPRHR